MNIYRNQMLRSFNWRCHLCRQNVLRNAYVSIQCECFRVWSMKWYRAVLSHRTRRSNIVRLYIYLRIYEICVYGLQMCRMLA